MRVTNLGATATNVKDWAAPCRNTRILCFSLPSEEGKCSTITSSLKDFQLVTSAPLRLAPEPRVPN